MVAWCKLETAKLDLNLAHNHFEHAKTQPETFLSEPEPVSNSTEWIKIFHNSTNRLVQGIKILDITADRISADRISADSLSRVYEHLILPQIHKIKLIEFIEMDFP